MKDLNAAMHSGQSMVGIEAQRINKDSLNYSNITKPLYFPTPPFMSTIDMAPRSCDGECEINCECVHSMVNRICESIDGVCSVTNEIVDHLTSAINDNIDRMEKAPPLNVADVRDVFEACTGKIIDAMEENTKKVTKAIKALAQAMRELKNS